MPDISDVRTHRLLDGCRMHPALDRQDIRWMPDKFGASTEKVNKSNILHKHAYY
ncbi:hypothetical protein WN48_07103 [Eufriesea mexicana]|uniref:Uncharacterized protein n=1 Tax=Eufriesea mexicana TaxID=516756 RepID=A0A310SVP3_9HYME|nr:hypothetical protein WN48_07103 [Eufriesea mexicana]